MSELSIVNYQFKNQAMLEQALTHKSFVHDGKKQQKHNETFEFLGDAVLDLALSAILMRRFPDLDEGILSKKRASLVNESVLAQIAQELNLSEKILLGKGEILSQGNKKPRLLASVYEALLGAIFIDGGYPAAEDIIEKHFESHIQAQKHLDAFESDFKTRLQEMVQADLKTSPRYQMVNEEGPSHSPTFETALIILDREVSRGNGKTKKQAEQEAAKKAVETWVQVLLDFGVRKENV